MPRMLGAEDAPQRIPSALAETPGNNPKASLTGGFLFASRFRSLPERQEVLTIRRQWLGTASLRFGHLLPLLRGQTLPLSLRFPPFLFQQGAREAGRQGAREAGRQGGREARRAPRRPATVRTTRTT